MSKGPVFSDDQVANFYGPAVSQPDLIRHYTLSSSDQTLISRCRHDHNRLGFAVMLCYLRYPGRPLRTDERPPAEAIDFIAAQIDSLPADFDQYIEQTRRRHSAQLQETLNLRPFGAVPAQQLEEWLVPHAIENDHLDHLAMLALAECRLRRILVPPTGSLQRICIRARVRARRDTHREMTIDRKSVV